MKLSLNREMVDQALERRGTNFASFVEAGRMQGKYLNEIAADLQSLTGVPFSERTFYRWVDRLEEKVS